MAKYIARLSAPTTNDKNWIHYSKGGYNYCVEIKNGSVLPNCTGYVWGRARELLGRKPNLSVNQAEVWYTHKDEYERGQTPKVGSIICWAKGSASTYKDGAGHVAMVEQVNHDMSIVIGQSGSNSSRFWTQTLKPPYNFGSGYTFQGFIYLPIEFDDDTNENSYKVFVKGVQEAFGAKVDGIAGPETLSKTLTLSTGTNRTHKAVKVLQSYLVALGYSVGSCGIDGIYGTATKDAIIKYQKANGCVADGIVTAKNKTWKKLLKLS